MIASAVLVPEPEPEPEPASTSPPPSLKRRQSSLDFSETSKRPRLDTHPSTLSNTAASPPPSASSPPRRKPTLPSSAAEERKRGQRLFGALLGTLARPSATPAHRKREAVEQAAQAKARAAEAENAEEVRRKREEIYEKRRKEDGVWRVEGRRLEWERRRAMAGFLQTRAEPVLLWKPWEMSEEEEAVVKKQREEVERDIAEEQTKINGDASCDEWAPGDVPGAEKEGESVVGTEEAHVDAKNKEEEAKGSAEKSETEALTSDAPMVTEPTSTTADEKHVERAHDDHGGEELVEGQEDDVIY